MRGPSWTNFALGIWLVLAPFALGYSTSSAVLWEDTIVGFLIAILALWRALAVEPRPGVGWTTVALGVWSVNAPFVLGYTTLVIALRNDVIVGISVAILAILSTLEKPREKLGRMTEQHHGAH